MFSWKIHLQFFYIIGEWNGGNLDVTNSFAIPFEEDPKESNIWFVDHNYHETMFNMFKKVTFFNLFVNLLTNFRLMLKKKLSVGILPELDLNNMILILMNFIEIIVQTLF